MIAAAARLVLSAGRALRQASRRLLRAPGLAATVVVTLALTFGANTAVFSALDAVLLEPLPFPDADRLVHVSQTMRGQSIDNVGPTRLEDWNERSSTFDALTGYYTEDVSDTSGDFPERLRQANVAPRFFDVWGITPVIGRGFVDADHEPGAAPIAVISARYFARRFESDPRVIGSTIRVDQESFSLVGVMSPDFAFADPDVDLWVPTVYYDFVLPRQNAWYAGYGRLGDGVTVEQARADLERVQAQLAREFPDTDRDIGVAIEPLKERTVGGVRASLWLLYGAVTVLLLIACTNIAALLLARAAQRRRDMAVRLALGSSRRSIAIQTLSEAAVLVVAGSSVGLFIAAGATAAFRRMAPGLPRVDEIAIDRSGFDIGSTEFRLAGRAADAESAMPSEVRFVSPGYFDVMQIPLLAGEPCRSLATGEIPDIVINRSFAARYFGGRSPLGQTLESGNGNTARIVAVYGDAREFGTNRAPVPTAYRCVSAIAYPPLSFVVRSQGDPASMINPVRQRAKELEPGRALYDFMTLEERMGAEHAADRLRSVLISTFATAALALVCLGIYGTLAYIVSLRRREVGLRVALGARQASVVGQFLSKAMRVVGVASAAGLAGSFAFSRTLSGMLFGVSPSDPVTLVAVIGIVLLVALGAAFLPALQASRIDPIVALREE